MELEKILNLIKEKIINNFPHKIYSFNEIIAELNITVDWIYSIGKHFFKSKKYQNNEEIIWTLIKRFFDEYQEKILKLKGPHSTEYRNMLDSNLKIYKVADFCLEGTNISFDDIKIWDFDYNLPKVGDEKSIDVKKFKNIKI